MVVMVVMMMVMMMMMMVDLNVTELTTALRRRTGLKLSAPVTTSSKLAPI